MDAHDTGADERKLLARAIANPANEVIVSVASAWGVAIKHALGKLPLHVPPARLVEISVTMFAVNVLPIVLDHALAAADLPHIIEIRSIACSWRKLSSLA